MNSFCCMFYILAKSTHTSGSDSHGLQYNSICSFFGDFGQNILNLLAVLTTCTKSKLLADLVLSSIKWGYIGWDLVQFSSVAQSCPTLCDPMNRSTPDLLVHHQLPEFTQTHIHRVSDAIQPSHPLSSPSPPAPNPSQHQSLFQ